MNFVHDYALLIAVSLPVLVIVAMQVVLFIGGERGTLLLPSLEAFRSIVIAEDEFDEIVPIRPEASPVIAEAKHQTMPELERKAA